MSSVGTKKPSLSVNRGELRANCLTVVFALTRVELKTYFLFEDKADGPEAEYEVTYNGQKSILEPSGKRGRLLPIASFETTAGASYRLEAGVIHRVNAIATPCITLVRTFERHVPIFSYGHVDEEAFDRRLCTNGEAEQIRRHLAQAALG